MSAEVGARRARERAARRGIIGRMPPRVRHVGLGLVLLCLAGTLFLGFLLKSQPSIEQGALRFPCAEGDWHGQQYTRLCYSDIVPLYGTEHLQGGRIPYVDACPASSGQCDEYPVLTMFTMYVAAQAADSFAGFFYSNVVLLGLAAGVAAIALYVMVGRRALWFALAPTLLIYGFMNWDLVAVALATAATAAFLARRDTASGILLGLGAAAKVYPALLVIPFAVHRLREREPDRAIHLFWAAVGAWLLVDLPFAISAPHGWSEFFRFNAVRPADFDSFWYVGCDLITGGKTACLSTSQVGTASAVAFVLGAGAVWAMKAGREPKFPRWTLGFPLLILFLLTNKVYSPQYGLWLLPWFPLALPSLGKLTPLRMFLLFEVTDVAVFVSRFSWFGVYDSGSIGGLFGAFFEIALIARAAVLVACLVAYVRNPVPEPGPGAAEAERQPASEIDSEAETEAVA
jgi:uncharacterized membrane protein